MDSSVDFQLQVARVVLNALKDHGFALAGSGAIRNHGIISRATQDIDAFRPYSHPTAFSQAVTDAITTLENAGFKVSMARQYDEFASLSIECLTTGEKTSMDLGVDWRSTQPTMIHGITTLSLRDAVMSKVHAVYSRAYPRVFLDLDAIRESRLFSDQELLDGLLEREPHISIDYFIQALKAVRKIEPGHVAEYDISAVELTRLSDRITSWAQQLDESLSNTRPFRSGFDIEPHSLADTKQEHLSSPERDHKGVPNQEKIRGSIHQPPTRNNRRHGPRL